MLLDKEKFLKDYECFHENLIRVASVKHQHGFEENMTLDYVDYLGNAVWNVCVKNTDCHFDFVDVSLDEMYLTNDKILKLSKEEQIQKEKDIIEQQKIANKQIADAKIEAEIAEMNRLKNKYEFPLLVDLTMTLNTNPVQYKCPNTNGCGNFFFVGEKICGKCGRYLKW